MILFVIDHSSMILVSLHFVSSFAVPLYMHSDQSTFLTDIEAVFFSFEVSPRIILVQHLTIKFRFPPSKYLFGHEVYPF